MTMKTTWGSVTVALVVAAVALPAVAAEGRIPIWQPVTIFPGGEGKYILTRDITAPPGLPAIDILPNTIAVDIDLNGFTIYGMAPSSVIQAKGVDSVTVRNGTIMFGGGGGGQAGIWATECRKVVVEDMKIEFIEGAGIFLGEVNLFSVRRNVITNANTMDGITVDGFFIDPTTPTEGTIEDNVIRDSTGGIGILNGSSVAVINNRIETTSSSGVFSDQCSSCLFERNTIEDTFGHGFELINVAGGKLHNNVVTKTQMGEGIWLQQGCDHNLVLDNVASMNGNNGLLVDGNDNHLERNVLNANGTSGAGPFWGMYLNGFGNVYRGNLAQTNPGVPPLCPGFPATTDFCDATGGANFSPFNQPPTLSGDNLMPGLL